MIICRTLEDIEAIEDPMINRIALNSYQLSIEEWVEQGNKMSEIGIIVVLETAEDFSKEEAYLTSDKGFLLHLTMVAHDEAFVNWEYLEEYENAWEILHLVNDEFGVVYLFRNDIDIPQAVRDALSVFNQSTR